MQCDVVDRRIEYWLKNKSAHSAFLQSLARKGKVQANRACPGDAAAFVFSDREMSAESHLRGYGISVPRKPQADF